MKPNEANEFDATITIRCKKSDKEQLEREAEDVYGVGLSKLLRSRWLGKPLRPRTDETVLRELRRQGGVLMQLGRHTDGRFDSDIRHALKALQAAAERIGKQVADGGQENS